MRKYYIDNIRWITVALVVVYHVVYMFNGIADAGVAGPFSAVQYQDTVQYLLYPWFMALLFILSGMCARYSLDTCSPGAFARARTRKLLVPSTVGLLVFHWIQGYVSIRLSHAEDMIQGAPGPVRYLILAVSGTGVLWYIQMLWVFSMALLLLRKLEKGRLTALCEKFPCGPVPMALLGVAVWGSAQVLNTPVIAVYRFGVYGFVFFLGYYLFSREKVMACLSQYGPLFAAAAFVLEALYTCRYFGRNYAVSPVVNCPLAVACLWFACLGILGCMKRFGDRTSPLARWMGKKSWGLYIFHYLPLAVCGMLLTEHTALPPACIYLLTGAAAFLGAYILYEVISRVPVLRWCVLGIRRTKKENHV